jgi:predicted ATPase/DNA-binding SARP family transcriptional activator
VSLWRLKLFGEVCLEGPGYESRNFGTIRAAKLLVILSLTRSARMPREHLAEQLWPDDLYDATRLRLRQEIHRLKKALGPAEGMVVTTTTDVGLDRSMFETDIDILKQIVQKDGTAKEGFDVETLFKNEFLPAWDEVWTMAERAPAEALQLQAAIAHGQHLLANGRAESALETAQWLIPKHPYNEEIRMVAVKAHGELGSLASAVAEYQQFRRGLKDALGVEPKEASEKVVKELTESLVPRARTTASVNSHLSEELSAANEIGGDIPNPIEPLIGRFELLKQVMELTSPASGIRLLTLVGPGGIGKTRLVIEAAQALKRQGDRRVLFVTLSEAASNSDWARVVAAQLRSAIPSDADPLTVISNVLKSEPTLLVLDNAETFMPEISKGVKRLLEASSTLSILATSITPLKIGGETPLNVGPLDAMTEGRQILVNALKTHRPLAAAVSANDEALNQIAQRLDGYPLALRLAAARFRILSPAALLQHLDSTGGLASSANDLPERHRSLESALAASYESLEKSDQTALQLLCALPGGAGMDLAAMLLGEDSHLDALERLLDSALVSLDDQGTFVRIRILGPVKGFVRESVHQEDWQAIVEQTRRTTAEYVKKTVPSSACWPNQVQMKALDEENENIHAAWDWAIEHDWKLAVEVTPKLSFFELANGRLKGALARIYELEDSWRSLNVDQQAELDIVLYGLQMLAGDSDKALESIERAESSLVNSSALELKARSAGNRASYSFRKDFWKSKDHAFAALQLAKDCGNLGLEARGHQLLGSIYWYSKEIESATASMTRAFDLYRSLNMTAQAGFSGLDLVIYHQHVGDKKKAWSILAEAKQLILSSNELVGQAHMHEIEGRMALSDDRAVEAEASFRESLRLWSRVESDFQEADQLLSLTRALLAQERWNEASETLLQSADKWVKDNNSGGLCQSMSSLALLLHKKGKTDLAQHALSYAICLAEAESLILVEPEIEFRDSIIELVGGIGKAEGPYSLLGARALFDQLL